MLLALVASAAAWAADLPDEDLNYSIMYKWGLINKEAGTAKLTLRNEPGQYRAMLAARTVPWADKIYKVRDTLVSVMDAPSCAPVQYKKLTHEGGYHSSDVLDYSQSDGTVTVNAERKRWKKSGAVSVKDTVLYGKSPAVDMLSVFYYMRHLDFATMQPGEKVSYDLFSGKQVEQLTITFNGTRSIKIDSKKYDTYEITFTFTHDGKSSDSPMYAWISSDSLRIPLKMEGKLPFGKVQAFFVNSVAK